MTVLREPDEVLVVEKPESQTLVVEKPSTVTVENQTSSTAVQSTTGYLVQTQEFGYPVVSGGVQGPRGIPGSSTQFETHVAGVTLGGHRAVYLDNNNQLRYPDLTSPDSFIIGITTQSAVTGTEVSVQLTGTITELSWNWIPGKLIFVQNNGILTQVPPTGQRLVLGYSTSPVTIFIDKHPPIFTE